MRLPKPEFTKLRDESYNLWHRTIGDTYYMIDIDSVEWRSQKGIVAFIETALYDVSKGYYISELLTRKEMEILILNELQERAGIPSFLVLHTPNLTTFWVFKIQNAKPRFWQTFSQPDYANFIRSLSKPILDTKVKI